MGGNRTRRPGPVIWALLAVLVAAPLAASGGGAHGPPMELLWIPLVLLAARLAGVVERWGMPAVLGELLVGVALGNLALAGFHGLDALHTDRVLAFLAELGVVILLFQVGLESTLGELRAVGARALLVAAIGVAVPFALGTYVLGPLLLPDQSFNAYLFLGAALTATSVGITARVFRDLAFLQAPEARIVLGAAVIDDVLGLLILAVVSALVTTGSVTAGGVAVVLLKAFGFLGGAVVLGRVAAPPLGRLFSRVARDAGMKLVMAVSLALLFAFVAGAIGLAPIVGAFAAGLVLEPVHFRGFREPALVEDVREAAMALEPAARERLLRRVDAHAHRHVDELVEPLGYFLVPLFFVLTGVAVDLRTLLDPRALGIALLLTVAAVAGKLASGLGAGPVRRWVVGWGMVPRGEVGLIFATMGRSLGVLDDAMFSIVVLVVIFSTLLAPPALARLLRPERRTAPAPGPAAAEPVLAHEAGFAAD